MTNNLRSPHINRAISLIPYMIFLFILTAGIALRLINLTNPPLDFHAWRQLRAASITRGIYYDILPGANLEVQKRAHMLGNSFEVLEPRIFEHIVAYTYIAMGGEYLWIARLYSILFWAVGGFALYMLARDMTSHVGAILSLSFYIFLPYGVAASRSFQPDPFMVMWIMLGLWSLYRWKSNRTWGWAIAAAVFSGLAVLVKIFAVFPITIVALIVVIQMDGLKKAIKNGQVWAVAGIMIIIPSIYYLFEVGNLAPGYIEGWVLGFNRLLFQPSFYIRWMTFLRGIVDLTIIALALASVVLFRHDDRVFVLGMWLGYLLIGMTVPSLIITHDYYSLFIIPTISLSLAPLGTLVFSNTIQRSRVGQAFLVLVVASSALYMAWIARNGLVSVNYRPEILGWIKMGKELPTGAKLIGITHDYNTRINYYGWTKVAAWPLTLDETVMHGFSGGNSDMSDPVWKTIFEEKTAGYDYFVVTKFDELDKQPVLKEILQQYKAVQGDGYIFYDLHQQK
jgi:4-amino-4-deoxy-L-arabinose transferase-like glycosyltransferase